MIHVTRLLLGVLVFASFPAFSCISGSIELNGDTALEANGIYSLNPSRNLEVDLTGDEFSQIVGNPSLWLRLHDSEGRHTHNVRVLAVNKDEGGIISTVYQVSDLIEQTETTVLVKSNYAGNGMYAKGLKLNPRSERLNSGLVVAECGLTR